MYAINHAATALVINKRYPSVPLFALLVAVQFVEVLWVVLNVLGIEHTTLVGGLTRLSDMPWSHSVATLLGYSVAAWLILAVGFGRRVLGTAIGLGIGSHLVLDLATHLPDIQLAPGIDSIRLGSGLYSQPLLAFAFESIYGVACWRVFGGSWRLLAVIVLNNLINLPLLFAAGSSPDPNGASAPTNPLAVSVVALEIVITWLLVWFFARSDRAAAAGGRRPARHSAWGFLTVHPLAQR
jgi:hypothetical protein